MTTAEVRLAQWPADTSRPVLELTTGQVLTDAAAEAPDRIALIEFAPVPACSDRVDRAWTYAQLLRDARSCARWLAARFAPGERIVVWGPNSRSG